MLATSSGMVIRWCSHVIALFTCVHMLRHCSCCTMTKLLAQSVGCSTCATTPCALRLTVHLPYRTPGLQIECLHNRAWHTSQAASCWNWHTMATLCLFWSGFLSTSGWCMRGEAGYWPRHSCLPWTSLFRCLPWLLCTKCCSIWIKCTQ